ncbi:hypothetical protein DOLIC_00057 [Dolichomitus sp. PSUC_FEM 10030005]|nr:hypothetical protein [Dolichomitus sp. PSUC_FEM 10030005]
MNTECLFGEVALSRRLLNRIVESKEKKKIYSRSCDCKKIFNHNDNLRSIKSALQYNSRWCTKIYRDNYRKKSVIVNIRGRTDSMHSSTPPSLQALSLAVVGNSLHMRSNHREISNYVCNNLSDSVLAEVVCMDILILYKKYVMFCNYSPINNYIGYANDCIIKTDGRSSAYCALWKVCNHCDECYITNNVYLVTNSTLSECLYTCNFVELVE